MGSSSRSIALPISPRINQLDAAMLDHEIVQHMSEQLKSALAYIPTHHFNFSPGTLSAVSNLLFFLATTARQLPTPGQSMLNIRLCSTSQAQKRNKSFGRRRSPETVRGLSLKRRMAFMVLSCLLPHAADAVISRLMRPLRPNESERVRVLRDRFRELMVAVRNLARFLSVVNAFAFIRHGYFRTLPARVAGVICIPIQVGASRNASFEFSNIAFVWKAISDFIQFVRVTVPISSWVSTAISSIRGQAQRLLPLVLSSRRYQCAVCGQVPSALPMFSHCDHVYCYGCAAQVYLQPEASTSCLICGQWALPLRHMNDPKT